VITNLSAKIYLSIAHTDQLLDETLEIFADALTSVTDD
jgi:hypothetical protein